MDLVLLQVKDSKEVVLHLGDGFDAVERVAVLEGESCEALQLGDGISEVHTERVRDGDLDVVVIAAEEDEVRAYASPVPRASR